MGGERDQGMRGPGDPAGADELLPLIYDKLRALARAYLRREGGYQTLDPTALVHEAYLRLADITRVDWQGRSHFFAMAARQMRRILVERARAAAAQRRGAGRRRITLSESIAAEGPASLDLLALDEALERLAGESPRQAQVAELRLFAGMQAAEIAEVIGVSERTARDDWHVARAWLTAELREP